MGLANIGVRTTNVTINNANHQIRAAAASRPRLLKWEFIQSAATAQSVGFGRPAAIAVTPGTSSLFQAVDPSETMVTNVDLTWGTSPTAPTVYMKRWNTAATIGVGGILVFPVGILIAASGALVGFNITAGAALDVNAEIDE